MEDLPGNHNDSGFDIPRALYDKARDHQDQLTEAERQRFLSRGDVVAKALDSPDSLTTEEIHLRVAIAGCSARQHPARKRRQPEHTSRAICKGQGSSRKRPVRYRRQWRRGLSDCSQLPRWRGLGPRMANRVPWHPGPRTRPHAIKTPARVGHYYL
ncbi:hypothetical protein VTI28DRAFT_2017 [Corynascus sepedonium]